MARLLNLFPNQLLEDIVFSRCLPVIGAGFSKNAELPNNIEMPSWSELGQSFSKDLAFDYTSSPLEAISAYSHEFTRVKLIERLHEELHIEKAKPGRAHLAFARLPFDIVLTTNFDTLLEKAYMETRRPFQVVIGEDQLSVNARKPTVANEVNRMTWIVMKESKGKIVLVSKNDVEGMLPKGSFLTVENGQSKFILRVDNSVQHSPYSPSPMLIDIDLSALTEDQKCQNILTAYRVKDIGKRNDGLIDYIRPQSIARRSTREEISLAFGRIEEGPIVLLATIHSSENQLISDESGKPMWTRLPNEMFYYQMMICGKTGSGKTVATKYFAQYFVEELNGAVLAINVKDIDFLRMDIPTSVRNLEVFKEWESLGDECRPHGIENFMVYYPASTKMSESKGVSAKLCRRITLDVDKIDPESLTGLLRGITDLAAQNLPSIFRYWRDRYRGSKFKDFVRYFGNGLMDKLVFKTLNTRGDESEVTLHKGTFDNVLRNLNSAMEFFDNEDAEALNEEDILVRGKMSVIDVAGENGIQFGAVILRYLLKRIVEAKSEQKSKVPILVIIDEVHRFYDTENTEETLGALDTICRTGRSQEIGVIFSSQNPSDLPRGLSTVINTKLFFKSESEAAKDFGIRISPEEMESLQSGFAAASIHGLTQLKFVKIPLAYAGVFE